VQKRPLGGQELSTKVGSILHGAYGDYYEQIVALRYIKWKNPKIKLFLFFANELRRKELEVFDLSFADGLFPREAIAEVSVDRFLQFQVFAPDLHQEVLTGLPPVVLSKIDLTRNVKPWTFIRKIWKENQALCDVPLSEVGRHRLPACEVDNKVQPGLFEAGFTIGFLWRYRIPGDFISPWGQMRWDDLIRMRSELFNYMIKQYKAHIIICGMNVVTTDSNRDRTDNKYTNSVLDLPAEHVTYLQGLSWGLELEIVRRCSLCILMASGFSEALWFKRRGKETMLVDAPYSYTLRLLRNRMPLFNIMNKYEILFQLRKPHSLNRIINHSVIKNLYIK